MPVFSSRPISEIWLVAIYTMQEIIFPIGGAESDAHGSFLANEVKNLLFQTQRENRAFRPGAGSAETSEKAHSTHNQSRNITARQSQIRVHFELNYLLVACCD